MTYKETIKQSGIYLEVIAKNLGISIKELNHALYNEAPKHIEKRLQNYADKIEKYILQPAKNYESFFQTLNKYESIEEMQKDLNLTYQQINYYRNVERHDLSPKVLTLIKNKNS